MKKIVLTGATGHIGNYVLNELISLHKNVVFTALPKEKINVDYPENVKVAYGDIRDKNFLNNIIDKNDVVIHLAGIISISDHDKNLIYDVNYHATKTIADICLAKNAKLIYTSSVHVLNPLKKGKIDEKSGFNVKSKRGPYEHSKSLATSYIFELFKKGLNGVVLYPSAILGPKDKFVGEVSNALLMIYKRKMPAYIKGGYSFVDVRDVASSIVKCALDENINKEGYIVSSEYITIKNLVKIMYEHYGYGRIPIYCPLFLVYIGLPFIALYSKIFHKKAIFTKIMLKTVLSNGDFDNSKAKKDLAFKTRPLIDSIDDQICWLKAQHPELF